MDFSEQNQLMELFLDFGEELMNAGAEISRVESSLHYLCQSYGAKKTDVFVITSSIVLTVSFDGADERTMTRRILSSGDMDYEKLRRLNALCRQCTAEPYPAAILKEKILAIAGAKPQKLKLYLGNALAAGAFTIFFGGTVYDGILAALFGAFICFLQFFLSPRSPNKVFFLFLSSLFCGLGIGTVSHFFPLFQMDAIIIGDIMLLVPGIAITEAVRDMLIGDTISGATKLLESLMRAAALAGGFMIAILLFGR